MTTSVVSVRMTLRERVLQRKMSGGVEASVAGKEETRKNTLKKKLRLCSP